MNLFDRIMGHWKSHCEARGLPFWETRKPLTPQKNQAPRPRMPPTKFESGNPAMAKRWQPTPLRGVSDKERVDIYWLWTSGESFKSVARVFRRSDKTVSKVVRDFLDGRCVLVGR